MTKHTLLIGTLLLLQCIPSALFSQTEDGQALAGYVRSINEFNRLNPQEKVYLHFDNTGYFLGETIWFKAYLASAANNTPDALSKVLYVELLTPQGEVIDSRKLKVENGGCHGEFELSKEYRSGFYEVRAYTRSMLNFGEECVFSRVFPIYDEPEDEGDYIHSEMDEDWNKNSGREKAEEKNEVNLSFYPEGGSAIVGIPSRIAFKVVDKKGEDLSISGMVYNQSDESVTSFSTLHQGMGVFELTPESASYTAEVEYRGKKHRFPLTDIISSGYVLKVDQPGEDDFLVQVRKSPDLSQKTVAVSISCRGTVYASEAVALGDEPYSFFIEKESLPAGSIQFTLFDTKGRILAERYAFNSLPVEYLTITAETKQEKLKPFEKVGIQFSVQDKMGNPVETSFSLAVRDVESEPRTAYQDNILTYLLLSSEVRGYIEKPGQYFQDMSRSTRTKLDVLMLVQAWRRYDWQQMAGVTPFEVKHYAEEGLGIHGKVMWYTRNRVQEEIDIMVWMIKEGLSFRGTTKTDKQGNFFFTFPDTIPSGKWQLGLQASKKGKRQHSRILLDRSFTLSKRAYSLYDLQAEAPLSIESNSIRKRSIMEVQLLKPVIVSKKKRKIRSTKPDIVLDVEKDINYLQDQGLSYPGTLGEYVESKLPTLRKEDRFLSNGMDDGIYRYSGRHTFWDYRYKREATKTKMTSMLLHSIGLDNIRVNEIQCYQSKGRVLPSFDINLFERIEIFHSNSLVSEIDNQFLESLPGSSTVKVIAYLYDDGLHNEYQKGIRYTYYNGYDNTRRFYHVDNSEKWLGDVDFRRTLYWNPNVKTNKEGDAQVDFYNNSSCKQVSISAEGLHSDGRPIILQEMNNNPK